jgi:hypothetical protein
MAARCQSIFDLAGIVAASLYQPALTLTLRHRPVIVMVAGGPPSTPLFVQAKGVDTGMRRHDGLEPSGG